MLKCDPRYLSRGEYDELRRTFWNYKSKPIFSYVDLLREQLEQAFDENMEQAREIAGLQGALDEQCALNGQDSD